MLVSFKPSILAVGLALASSAALADPGYYVVTPYDNAGIRTIDFRYWTVKFKNSPEVVWPEVGFGYGVNSRWTTELFVSYIGSSQMATRPSTLNWQNDVLLTQGELPVDIAVHAQLIKDMMRHGLHSVELGPVLQTDVGRTQLNANVFFEHAYGDGASGPTQLKYQWQVRHRWMPELHVGLQGFGELGRWNDWAVWDKQSHRAGPALYTKVRFGEHEVLKLQAAYLLGRTYGQRGHMFTARVNYEF